jgi:uncharacterized protein YcbK (DUF882 family)
MEQYTFGAIKNPIDLRDVPASAFQPAVETLPVKFITDISMIPVMNQMGIGSCVGHAIGCYLQYLEYKESGKFTSISPRYVYAMAKAVDGLTSQGTYPRTACDQVYKNGAKTEDDVKCDDTLSHDDYINVVTDLKGKYKIKGYAFVPANANEIKQAIINNGLVVATLAVGDFSSSHVHPGTNGYHYITIYGYDGDTFYFRNSWGNQWGDKGNGTFNFAEFKDQIFDVMAITDVPNEIKDLYKGISYKKGQSGLGIIKLQKDLKALGYFKYPVITGYFGSVTESAVKAFQKAYGLYVDGIAGKNTLTKIDELKKKSKIDFGLLPDVQAKADLLIEMAGTVGMDIKIVEGYRSQKRQDFLYASGRTRTGPILTMVKVSKHTSRKAFDICFTGVNPYPNDDIKWKHLADIGQSIGLRAGYYFDGFKDSGHFEV